MKRYIAIIGVLALVVLGGLWAMNARVVQAPGGTACTMEAKLCPDGSAVGRTGPNCEFAECPAVASGPVTLETRIGQEVGGLGVRIAPIEILEDSRCPIGVQCIWAGTVRVRASLTSGTGTAPQEFVLGEPITTETETVTLTEVLPAPKAGVKIADGDYRLTFEVAKRVADGSGSILPYNSGVRGTVLLGPTCPVMRNPPDPQCADKPYATTITVHRTGATAVFATGKSDASGAFTFSLPPGNYTLTASGGTMLPRCAPADVSVGPTGYATANISCDTGIR